MELYLNLKKMKYHQIDKDLFIKNRKKFASQMKPNGLAIFNSNDIYPVSADSTLPFAQHRDIFYLSGVDQEESILLIFPDAPYENQREILFLKETNEHIAVWEGEKLTKERAFEVSGINNVIWLQDFDKTLKELMSYADTMYINTNEHYRATIETETREARFIKKWKNDYPAHKVEKSNPILQRIRSVKESEELDLIQDSQRKLYGENLSFEGATQEEIEEASKPTIPEVVTRRQFKIALAVLGYNEENILNGINQLPEPNKTIARISYTESGTFERNSDDLNFVAKTFLSLTDEQIDEVFLTAITF